MPRLDVANVDDFDINHGSCEGQVISRATRLDATKWFPAQIVPVIFILSR